MGRIWRYVVRYDDGLAPCVEDKFLTLTCCKPGIRKHASKGDWIVGFHSSTFGKAMLCYLMRVTENPMPYADYWGDSRFAQRRDNIYRPENGKLVWVPNQYSDHDDEKNFARDHRGVNSLISNEYWYFNKDETFSLYDHFENGIVNRLWFAGRGAKYNGLLPGDFETLLDYVECHSPLEASHQPTVNTQPSTCNRSITVEHTDLTAPQKTLNKSFCLNKSKSKKRSC